MSVLKNFIVGFVGLFVFQAHAGFVVTNDTRCSSPEYRDNKELIDVTRCLNHMSGMTGVSESTWKTFKTSEDANNSEKTPEGYEKASSEKWYPAQPVQIKGKIAEDLNPVKAQWVQIHKQEGGFTVCTSLSEVKAEEISAFTAFCQSKDLYGNGSKWARQPVAQMPCSQGRKKFANISEQKMIHSILRYFAENMKGSNKLVYKHLSESEGAFHRLRVQSCDKIGVNFEKTGAKGSSPAPAKSSGGAGAG